MADRGDGFQEYLGSYVTDEAGRLVFREGALVAALRRGHWVVLDELNLAPTEVLEALNRRGGTGSHEDCLYHWLDANTAPTSAAACSIVDGYAYNMPSVSREALKRWALAAQAAG